MARSSLRCMLRLCGHRRHTMRSNLNLGSMRLSRLVVKRSQHPTSVADECWLTYTTFTAPVNQISDRHVHPCQFEDERRHRGDGHAVLVACRIEPQSSGNAHQPRFHSACPLDYLVERITILLRGLTHASSSLRLKRVSVTVSPIKSAARDSFSPDTLPRNVPSESYKSNESAVPLMSVSTVPFSNTMLPSVSGRRNGRFPALLSGRTPHPIANQAYHRSIVSLRHCGYVSALNRSILSLDGEEELVGEEGKILVEAAVDHQRNLFNHRAQLW